MNTGSQAEFVDVFAEGLASLHRRFELRDQHRTECTKRPCERCEIWVCAQCKADTDTPADDRDGSRRPALCVPCGARWERRLLLAPAYESLPPQFAWAIPSRPEARKLLAERCPSYRSLRERLHPIVRDGQSMVLAGPSGSGKTSLGAYQLRWVLERGESLEANRSEVAVAEGARFVSARDLATARQQIGFGKGEAKLVKDAMGATVLLIDDAGSESESGRQTVIDVVAYRYDRGFATWVTTWLERAAFIARFGGGTERRLVEGGTWVQIGEGS